MYAPIKNELYIAVRGFGSFLNGKLLSVSKNATGKYSMFFSSICSICFHILDFNLSFNIFTYHEISHNNAGSTWFSEIFKLLKYANIQNTLYCLFTIEGLKDIIKVWVSLTGR